MEYCLVNIILGDSDVPKTANEPPKPEKVFDLAAKVRGPSRNHFRSIAFAICMIDFRDMRMEKLYKDELIRIVNDCDIKGKCSNADGSAAKTSRADTSSTGSDEGHPSRSFLALLLPISIYRAQWILLGYFRFLPVNIDQRISNTNSSAKHLTTPSWLRHFMF